MKSLERVLLGGALEAKVSPSVTVSLEVATTAGALFFNFCAWILGCDPKTVHNTIGVNPSEFPQKPQHEMKVRFPGLGKSRRGHKRQGEPGATAGRGRGVEGWRGDVFGNRWSGWSCKWAVRMAGQPHLDWSLCLQATPQFSGGASAQRAACLCRGPGSHSEQRQLSPGCGGCVHLPALVTCSPIGQRGSPPRGPPHNTLVTWSCPGGRGGVPAPSWPSTMELRNVSGRWDCPGACENHRLPDRTPWPMKWAALSDTRELASSTGSAVAEPARYLLPSRLHCFRAFTNVGKAEDAFSTRSWVFHHSARFYPQWAPRQPSGGLATGFCPPWERKETELWKCQVTCDLESTGPPPWFGTEIPHSGGLGHLFHGGRAQGEGDGSKIQGLPTTQEFLPGWW